MEHRLASFDYSTILTWLIVLPLAGSAIVALLPPTRVRLIRNTAISALAGMVVLAAVAVRLFNWAPSVAGHYQLMQILPWIPPLHATYFVGVDALSLYLILFTTALGLLTAVGSYGVGHQLRAYYISIMLLTGFLIGALAAENIFLFALFFMLSIFPMYFITGLWGGERRQSAALKFGLLALVSAGLLFAAAFLAPHALHPLAGASSRPTGLSHWVMSRDLAIVAAGRTSTAQWFLWLIVIGFGLRLGIPGLHIWLPDYCCENTGASAMLVLGGNFLLAAYSVERIAGPLLHLQSTHIRVCLAWVIGIGVILIALSGLAQNDLGRLLACWTSLQAGLISLGVLAFTSGSLEGAMLETIGAVITLASMLWVCHILQLRAHHRDLSRLGGISQLMPGLFGLSLPGFIAAMAVPGFCLFAGEFLVTRSVFGLHPGKGSSLGFSSFAHWQAVLGVTVILGLFLMIATLLWTIERVFFGSPRPEYSHFLKLSRMERLVLLPLVTFNLALGLFPMWLIIDPLSPTIRALAHLGIN
jgi:NADH-quinone oxidoreductase subunit M